MAFYVANSMKIGYQTQTYLISTINTVVLAQSQVNEKEIGGESAVVPAYERVDTV